MMKKFGKLLALLTAAAMITASAAIPVLADDADETAGEAVTETVEILESEEDESEEAEEAVEEAEEDEETEEAAEAVELFDDETETVELFDTTALPDAVDNVITLTEDITIDSVYEVSGTLTIDLSGHTITGSVAKLITVPEGASLTIKDTSDDKDGKVYTSTGYCVYSAGGSVTIESGTIEAKSGGAVYSACSSATLTITGGTINGNSSYGVYVVGGSLKMSNATVNAAYAVYLKKQGTDPKTESGYSETITGYTSAEITDCNIYGTTKGIQAETGGTLTVKNTEANSHIVKNTGNLYAINTAATSTVLENLTVTSTGGTAITSSSDNCTITNCTISGTKSTGGAVVISSGTATISGGSITNTNTSSTSTYLSGLQVSGGTVTVNNETEITSSAKIGVYVSGGSIDIESATITGGSAGIFVNNPTATLNGSEDGSVSVEGGKVTGGITANKGTVTISGGTISGTLTESSDDGKITITGGTYTDSNVSDYLTGNYVATENTGESTYTVQTAEAAITASGVTATMVPAATYQYEASDDDTASPTPTPTVIDDSIISGTEVASKYFSAATTKTITGATITKIQRIDEITNYSYDESTGELSMDIEPYIEYTYNTDSDNGLTTRDKLELSEIPAYVTIPLPSGVWADGASVAVTHDYNTGGSEVLYGIVESDSVTVVTNNGFSTWTVATAQAEEIFVGFEKDSDGVYKMYLTSTEGGIYRYLSSEFEFTLTTTDDIGYTVAPYSDSTIVNNMTTSTDSSGNTVYAFNLDDTSPDTNGVSADQDEKIYIATVTFTGIGSFTFSINENYTDTKVNTAVYNKSDNNIVKTYTVGVDTDKISKDADYGTINGSLTLDTAYLNIYVYFPNKAEFQSYEYEKMMITIESPALVDPITVELGNYTDSNGTAKKGKVECSDENKALFGYYYSTISEIEQSNVYDYYGYLIYLLIPADYTSTLTFSGDGYRTYSTSITPAGNNVFKTITVWNNVMDNAETVISAADNAMGAVTENVTFLAGDIVANNKIDLWDLSAVVSYFGKGDLTTYDDISEVEDYIKYDLNRDGKIDSKDIAMVLVSWDN